MLQNLGVALAFFHLVERVGHDGQIIGDYRQHETDTGSSDVQVALLTPPESADARIVLRATRQPLVAWLWIGGLVMLFGTALSAFPGKHRRRPTDPVSAPVPVDAADE